MNGQNVDKMYTYLKGFCDGAKLTESLCALSYMRQKHGEQTRKSGELYIVHPLSMACYAAALDIRDDNTIAIFLLHDVCEDCKVSVEDLPFNETIKKGVKYMTIQEYPDEQKHETKRRYYHELTEHPLASLCKGADRDYNLATMIGVLPETAIVKNIVETHCLLLPMLKRAKNKWPEMSNYFHVYRTNIIEKNDMLAKTYGVILNDDGTSKPSIEEVFSENFVWPSESTGS